MPRLPYGTWPSPITAELVARGGVALAEIHAEGEDLYWIETRPEEGGRHTIMRLNSNGSIQELLPPDYNARTRVHEYGGGHFAVRAGIIWFANFTDQRLYRLGPNAGPTPITAQPRRAGSARFADMVATPGVGWLICVRETHPRGAAAADVVNELVAVPADGEGKSHVLAAQRDFYAAPRISPDGRTVAWLSWDHPNMPWDGTDLFVAELDVDTDQVTLGDRTHVAGDRDESVTDPAFGPDGTLYAASDRTGWWNLYRFDPAGGEAYRATNLHETEAEFTPPMWQLGPPSYGFLNDGRIACRWFDDGRDRVGVLDPETGDLEDLEAMPVTAVASLAAAGPRVVVAGATPTDPPGLHTVSLPSGVHRTVREPKELGLDPAWFAPAEAVTFGVGDDEVAHGLVYLPTNPDVEAPLDGQPPLLVLTHGGPTGHSREALSLQLAYWTSRGFAVVDVNYRGSTGYGRAYRESLYGRWGLVDVEDTVAAAEHLVDRGLVDPSRMAIRGGSAGGYTTLRALTSTDAFAAGASFFGVADVGALDAHTHKFESRYMERLVPPDEYDERSPINHTDQLSAPMILFQGLEDEIVPPEQAEQMVEALDAKGLAHAYVTFAGEQHGFRKAESIVRWLESELVFYGAVFGFEPDGDLPDLEIHNL